MSKMRLYANKGNLRCNKINVVASYVNATVELVPFFEVGKDNKKEEYLKMNPTGKVPVLETEQGFVFESNAICWYLASLDKSAGLLGQNELETAQVKQWLDFCTNEIEPSAIAWLMPIFGKCAYKEEVHTQAVSYLKAAFQALNRHLEFQTYVVGERMTIADIVIASTLAPLYQRVIDPRFRGPFINLNRWFETISLKQKVKEVLKLEQAAWCTVSQKPQKVKEEAKESAPVAEAAVEVKAEEKKTEEKPKAEKKPKKKSEDDDDEEEDEKEEPAPKNELDELPKSAFPLDQFKREYSNKKVEESSQYLFDNFDYEGYCMYWCTYKYNDECTVPFRTANLVGGFYQRLERLHKYAFGQMLILGTEKQHEIAGFWIFRGQKVPSIMEDVPDTELYEWKKIEKSEVEDQKAKIVKFLNWEEIDGKACLDGKTFK